MDVWKGIGVRILRAKAMRKVLNAWGSDSEFEFWELVGDICRLVILWIDEIHFEPLGKHS